MKRAEFLKNSLVLAGASVVLPSFASPVADSFSLPALPYAFDALEPHIDRLTMEIHHDRHHKAYVDNLNKALPGTTKSIEEILASVSSQPVAVRNNGGGHWNHSFFWNVLAPAKGSKPSTALAKQIDTDFGSFDAFKAEFAKAATSRFGSGWAWLIKKDGKLVISSTPNQDNPLMDLAEVKGQPILALDVWEHAYYLKYMNKRADYIAAFWNLVNWDFVSTNFEK
jgi:Fe-Mn family superoxide dismutase